MADTSEIWPLIHAERAAVADTLGGLTPEQWSAPVTRLRATVTTTNHPPGPATAMLGEIVVHGQDIRVPLGLPGTPAPAAVVASLEMYQGVNFPVGAKRRIAGLRLVATDVGWSHGEGPEVSGPGASLVMAMTGRAAGLAGLTGEGTALLRSRIAAG